MKIDKKLWNFNKKSREMDVKSYFLNEAIYFIDDEAFHLDRTHGYWGPIMNSEQFFKYIKNKKGENS